MTDTTVYPLNAEELERYANWFGDEHAGDATAKDVMRLLATIEAHRKNTATLAKTLEFIVQELSAAEKITDEFYFSKRLPDFSEYKELVSYVNNCLEQATWALKEDDKVSK